MLHYLKLKKLVRRVGEKSDLIELTEDGLKIANTLKDYKDKVPPHPILRTSACSLLSED